MTSPVIFSSSVIVHLPFLLSASNAEMPIDRSVVSRSLDHGVRGPFRPVPAVAILPVVPLPDDPAVVALTKLLPVVLGYERRRGVCLCHEVRAVERCGKRVIRRDMYGRSTWYQLQYYVVLYRELSRLCPEKP